MIRREFNTNDGDARWLLISQVEHARLSGQLARNWCVSSEQGDAAPSPLVPASVLEEIYLAVAHHDDGWALWEANPQIDPEHGRPYAFMNEMPLEESLAIWDRSIDAARQIGPLAGWMVASHFYALLDTGNHAEDKHAVAWLDSVDRRRQTWFDDWRQADVRHTLDLAERAVGLLRACDFLSLWLCCECPVAADEAAEQPPPFELSGPQRDWQFIAHPPCRKPGDHEPFSEPGWLITADPWPFEHDELQLAADAWLAPIQRYESSESLCAARRPIVLRWRLRQSSAS